MSDVSNDENSLQKKFERLTETPFFNWARPYMDFIAKGKIFRLVYLIMAVVNLVLPFVILYMAAKSGIFQAGAKFVFAIILSWFVVLFACWIGFQLWLERRKKIIAIGESQFVATVMFTEIFQTFGEWLGTMVGIISAGAGLLGTIFLGEDVSYLLRSLGLGSMNFGIAIIVIGPVIGFFIMLTFRFIAEQMRMFATLVNNTGEIAKKS